MENKFTLMEVAALRNDLVKNGLDWFQAAEAISAFIAGHGYGIAPETARAAASRMERRDCSAEAFHEQLETLALAM